MKPRAFTYRRASTIQEVVELLANNKEAKVIAGGQSLVPMMNLRLVSPSLLIDLNGIDDLKSITTVGSSVRIGALVRHRDIEINETVRLNVPILALAAAHVAHQAVRNRGTIGGSISHSDPAAEFPACAVLLNAVMEVASARGNREIAAREFFQGAFTTALKADELLLAMRVPVNTGYSFGFHELSRRKGDFALSGLAARADTRADNWNTDWVAFGVSDRPVILGALRRLFLKRKASGIQDDHISIAIAEDFEPIEASADKIGLKRILTSELVRRVMADFSRARQ
jgi:carbon-monoxide dehydrogenase medium subunit